MSMKHSLFDVAPAPLRIVTPEINDVFAEDMTLKIRKGGASGCRSIATRLAPGPAIRTFFEICNSLL